MKARALILLQYLQLQNMEKCINFNLNLQNIYVNKYIKYQMKKVHLLHM